MQNKLEKTPKEIQIKIRGLNKAFYDKVVLSNLDLDVFKNESLVILGGSGAGKSVLIKCIVGLLTPDSGSIIVNDRDVLSLSGIEYETFMSTFGFLFQRGALFDSLTILENVAFYFIYNKNTPNEKARLIASENLAKVGLDNSVLDLYPSQLSGGMQKRVAFARTIAHNPKILFFDEPTTGLDPILTTVVNNLIIHCRNILKATSITITHDINSARKIASRIAMLHQGKIIWTGNVKDLDHSKNKTVEQFIHGNITGPIANPAIPSSK